MNRNFFVVIVFFCMLLAGCRIQNDEKTIIFTHFYDEKEINWVQSIINDFNRSQDTIFVKTEYIPFFNMKPHVLSSKGANFDIFTGAGDWAGELAKEKIIYVSEERYDYSGDYLKNNGKIRGLVRNYEFPVFYYYNDMFDEKDIPESIDEIFSLFGQDFLYDVKDFYYHIFIASFFGNEFLNADNFDLEDKNFKKSIEFVKKYVSSRNISSLNYDAVVNMFASKKLSVILDGQWNYDRHKKNGAEILNIFPPKIYAGSKVYFMADKKDKIDYYLEFLRFLKKREDVSGKLYNYYSHKKNVISMPAFPEMKDFWVEGNNILYKKIITGI